MICRHVASFLKEWADSSKKSWQAINVFGNHKNSNPEGGMYTFYNSKFEFSYVILKNLFAARKGGGGGVPTLIILEFWGGGPAAPLYRSTHLCCWIIKRHWCIICFNVYLVLQTSHSYNWFRRQTDCYSFQPPRNRPPQSAGSWSWPHTGEQWL